VHWSADGWKTVTDTSSRDTTLGVHSVDLPTTSLLAGVCIDFTFYWPQADRWEGTNFCVMVE
jgi:glucoamylase